jgi:sugar-phosphatase
VLFDLDGTLVDSTAAVARSWKRWGDEYGLVQPSFEGWHGRPAAHVAASFLPPDRVAAGVARIEEIEIEDVADLVPLPGADDALAACGEWAAIVTSCTMPLAKARLTALNVSLPRVIVTADQVTNGKPDPEPFLLAAQRMGVDPADCLVVEDAPAGLMAAASAKMTSLAVVTTHTPSQLDADEVVPNLAAVRFMAGPSGVVVGEAVRSSDSLKP